MSRRLPYAIENVLGNSSQYNFGIDMSGYDLYCTCDIKMLLDMSSFDQFAETNSDSGYVNMLACRLQ